MTHSKFRAVAALFSIAATLIMLGCGQGPEDDHTTPVRELVFSAVPSSRMSILLQSHQPVRDMIRKETGMEIRFQTGTDYAAVIKGLRDGRIDIAALGPFSYVLAKDQGAQITAVAARVDAKGDDPGYRSYGITWTGSPVKTLADFRGRRICFVDHNSTSGYLYPNAALLALGIEPEKDTVPLFSGRHDAAVLAVANHHCDAGFALDTMVDRRLVEQGQLQPGQITTVWRSGAIPSPPIVIADRLPSELRQKLIMVLRDKANADYLRANGFCQGACAIADGVSYGYKQADDADYNGVREICRTVRISSCSGV